MNETPPGMPPQGQGWQPPNPNQGWPLPHTQPQQNPAWQPGFPPPAGPPVPPKGSNTGRTLLFLGLGLVLVIAVIGVVALVVRGGDSDDAGDSTAKGGSGAHDESCQTYADLTLNSEIWAATDFDPDKLKEMYDAVLDEIADDDIHALVTEESEVVVGYYRDLGEWKQQMMDAMGKGETPDTELPAEVTAQQADIQQAKGAVLEACQDAFPDAPDEPIPSLTAPTLDIPDWMKE